MRFGRVWRGPVCQIVPVAAQPGEMPGFAPREKVAKLRKPPTDFTIEGSMLRGVHRSRKLTATTPPCKTKIQS